MTLFAFPAFEAIGRKLQRQLPEIEHGKFAVRRFANQELYVTVSTPVTGHRCTIFGSIAPSDEHLLSTLLVAHSRLYGEFSEQVIMVDDMLDTGGTLLSACQKLRRKGAPKITVMVTTACLPVTADSSCGRRV